MPLPTLRVRRSARRFPANTLRETMWRCSSVFKNRSSNSSDRSCARLPFGATVAAAAADRANLDFLRGLEDLGDDGVGLHAFLLAFEVHDQPVAQRGGGDVADVV